MNVVIDTNVIVSGLLSPYSPPGEIVRMIATGRLRLLLDARVLLEYSEVLRRPKFQFDTDLVSSFLDQIEAQGRLVSSAPLRRSLPDPDDEPFLEVALAGDAECLVTGNLRHFPARAREGISVLSPSRFLEYYTGVMGGALVCSASL